MAILVILVLSVVAVGVALFTQIEDRTSGNVKLSKVAFYAAETGLRQGEIVISQAVANRENISSVFLDSASVGSRLTSAEKSDPHSPWQYQPPGGGSQGLLLNYQNVTYLNRIVPSAPGATDGAAYTIYARAPLDNYEGAYLRVNLFVVGQAVTLRDQSGVQVIDRVLTTKIIEEQLDVRRSGSETGVGKQLDQGGTGSTTL